MGSLSRVDGDGLASLVELLARGGVVVLTGAGVSTASGIPDYRDDDGAWKHRPPVQYRDFVGSPAVRRRYWARSLVGWARLADAAPNAAHGALAALERSGLLGCLVTQNVDGLHERAGSSRVIDLHGRIDRVVCLACRQRMPRSALQAALAAQNPGWLELGAATTPDGDAELGAVPYEDFRVVDCECGGMLKPDVVFFGENVPPADVERAMTALSAARSFLIVGSSLMVFSGFRFARAAAKLSIPIAVVNRGRTRADDLAALKVGGDAGQVLTDAMRALGGGGAA